MKLHSILFLFLISGKVNSQELMISDTSRLVLDFQEWTEKHYDLDFGKRLKKKLRYYRINNFLKRGAPKISPDVRYCIRNRKKIQLILFPAARTSITKDSGRILTIASSVPFHTSYILIDNQVVGEATHDWIKIQEGYNPQPNEFVLNVGLQVAFKNSEENFINFARKNSIRFMTCDKFWYIPFFLNGDKLFYLQLGGQSLNAWGASPPYILR